MRLIVHLLVLVMVAGSFSACVSKKKYNELAAAKEQTDQALAETQAQVKNLEEMNMQLKEEFETEKTKMTEQIEGLRADLKEYDTKMAEVRRKLDLTEEQLTKLKDELNGMFEAYEASGLKMDRRDGRLYLMTDEDLQYRTGSSSLSRAERDALKELAEKMKTNSKIRVLVEGHTDDKKYSADSGMDNWQLSVNRAMGVVRYLIGQGVDPSQVAAIGRGEYMPEATNDTSEGRSKNRRTVILPDTNIGPLLDEMED